MKKSEMIREAFKNVRRHRERVCYCTPNRQMALSLEHVCMNQNVGSPAEQRKTLADLMNTVAERLRELTNRWHEKESLHQFDENDSRAAYALNDRIVEEAFEKAAVVYEERGD